MLQSALYTAAMRAAEIRKAKGLSQTDLAELVGVEQPTIFRFERGSDSVTLGLVRRVAAALDVPVYDLFADPRTSAELSLLEIFRQLPADRQRGWLDMARSISADLHTPS